MWSSIRKWFKDSETILWARLQMLGGAVLQTLAVTDPNLFSQYIPSKWVPVYLFAAGIVTEFARRLRDPEMK